MDTFIRDVLLARSYSAQNFHPHFTGVVYNNPQLSMNIFLKVIDHLNTIYKKYPFAHVMDMSKEALSCMEEKNGQLLIIDQSYHVINHSCWTLLAHKIYHSLSNLETYSIYENPFQAAFIPSSSIIQFLILIVVFFSLLIQFT